MQPQSQPPPWRRRPFTFVGMALALITLGAFLFVATQQRGAAPVIVPGSGSGSSPVVFAKADIAARSTITADMLVVSHLNANDVPPQTFKSVADVVNSKQTRFALIDIKGGQPVLANELVTSATAVTGPQAGFLDIPQGFVALTIPTGEQQGVAGYIQPGDYIGIIAVVDHPPDQTTSKTVFNNVHVIRVGTASTTITPGAHGPVATTTAGQGTSSLTVVMNECDAEYLTWFIAKAPNLRYTLENYQDYDKGTSNNPNQAAACKIDSTTGVTNADVSKRFGAGMVP